MLCISPFSWSPRISVPPWSLESCSSSRCGEAGKLTSWWWGMRLKSCSNSYCSISIFNCLSDFSISRAKSCSCDGSPYLPDANCSDESTTSMGVVSSVCTCCAPLCICCCCAYLSSLCSSYSFQSFSFNSCNSFSVSSSLLSPSTFERFG